jgi:hypothetical protein
VTAGEFLFRNPEGLPASGFLQTGIILTPYHMRLVGARLTLPGFSFLEMGLSDITSKGITQAKRSKDRREYETLVAATFQKDI